MAQIQDKAKQIQKLKSMGQYGSPVPSQGKRDAFVNLQRQKFFGDRNIPEERVLRRTRQEGGIRQFKDALIRNDRVLKGTRFDGSEYTVMNPNTGEPVYLSEFPGGRTVSDVAQDLAFRFGPTPREVAGDIGYGIKSIASSLGKGFAEGNIGFFGAAKNLALSLYDKAVQQSKDTLDMLKKNVISNKSDLKQEIIDRGKDKSPYTWNQVNNEIQEEAGINLDLSTLNATQRATYDMLTTKNNPLSHEEALAQVKQQFTDNRPLDQRLQDITQKRNGGIVSLIR